MTALIKLYKTDHAALVTWVVKTYGLTANEAAGNANRYRRETIAQRIRLYRDDAQVDFERIIEIVFETDDVKLQRKKMIAVATEQNVTRRIIDEVASLYDRPAVRTLADPGEDKRFHDEAEAVELDEVMQEKQRLMFLCNEVLIWRAAPLEDGDPAKLHIVTPDCFDAIPHPKDKLELAGVIIDRSPSSILEGAARATLPHYELWDDTYQYLISGGGLLVNEDGTPNTTGPIEHGLGRIPGVILHRRKPVDKLLDARSGRDITSAHLGVGLLSIMIMRLAKSQGERQPVLQGNLANVAAGQTMDGEKPIVLPPEVTAMMLETRTDPSHYLDGKKDKLTSVAQTYGMSYEQMNNQETDVGSGRLYEVRRQKLTELRNEQVRRARRDEKEVVVLMGYDAKKMKVDHSEQAAPLNALEEVELLDAKMRMGLDSPVKYIMRKDPDLDRDSARVEIQENLADYAILMVLVRALNLPAKADAANPGQDPTLNGGLGGKKGLAVEDPEAAPAPAPAIGSVARDGNAMPAKT